MRFAHVNLVVRDLKSMIAFYEDVFGCQHIGQTRNLHGRWLEDLTGIESAHIVGEHLLLPGTSDATLEIFRYDPAFDLDGGTPLYPVNRPGFGHIAFEVVNVEDAVAALREHGGATVGDVVSVGYEDGRTLTVVYARDPEGNIIELQAWSYAER